MLLIDDDDFSLELNDDNGTVSGRQVDCKKINTPQMADDDKYFRIVLFGSIFL
jgi:hypothetical protein